MHRPSRLVAIALISVTFSCAGFELSTRDQNATTTPSRTPQTEPTAAPASASVPIPDSPRDRAALLLERALPEGNVELARSLITPTYKQHNPRVADGPEGLLEMVDYFARHEEARPRVRVVRAITDSDFVVLHSEYQRRGRKIVGVDMFRLEDGKLAEHWDAGMPIVEPTASGHGVLDGLAAAGDGSVSVATREIAKRFAQEVLVDQNQGTFDALVDSGVVQHETEVKDGSEAWRAALKTNPMRPKSVIRVRAEGTLAAIQLRAKTAAGEAVVYDILRIEDGHIREHWRVWEDVPQKSDNTNGMF